MNDPKELYKVYADWSGQLHHWVQTRLGRQIDAEFFPDTYQFKLYSGGAENEISISGVPQWVRPLGERSITIQLPRPKDDPSQADLDAAFRELCLAAARVLEIDLGKAKLTE
jgi:hypothetical protein